MDKIFVCFYKKKNYHEQYFFFCKRINYIKKKDCLTKSINLHKNYILFFYKSIHLEKDCIKKKKMSEKIILSHFC